MRACVSPQPRAVLSSPSFPASYVPISTIPLLLPFAAFPILSLQTNTWRITAIICFIAQFVTAALVCMGACCQAFTCGCCGASLDLLAMIIYWIEVILSIVAWSFAIVANNMVNNANVEGVGGGYEWAFWLFIVTGTILGAICAMLTSWASDDSIIRKCFRCVFCCCRKGDD
uniref:Uncharacterized protein n=1 Tax=Pseudictyota dubia TaxID=2749911 RepID=A0A7R9W1U4_9STRA|mmetsp:Transcript_29215/g.54145  ORF Transcript_29215/g.54145 Transcript_29215/m.54145 type:complete len:172 (+) Transcript_29215:621-1136(+)